MMDENSGPIRKRNAPKMLKVRTVKFAAVSSMVGYEADRPSSGGRALHDDCREVFAGSSPEVGRVRRREDGNIR